MKAIKLFVFALAIAIATPAAAQVKVLGKSGSSSTAKKEARKETKKEATKSTKKSASKETKKSTSSKPARRSFSSAGSDYPIQGWQSGVMVGYTTEMEAFGIGGRLMYGINDEMRLDLNDSYYFKSGFSYLDEINLNFQYLFNIADNMHIYPLAGLAMLFYKLKGGSVSIPDEYKQMAAQAGVSIPSTSNSDNFFGGNIGAGFQYAFNDKLAINAEGKVQFYFKEGAKSTFTINAGIIYHW